MDTCTSVAATWMGAWTQPDPSPLEDGAPQTPTSTYSAPEIVRFGSAVGLIRQHIEGQLIDGNDGWWVWGS